MSIISMGNRGVVVVEKNPKFDMLWQTYPEIPSIITIDELFPFTVNIEYRSENPYEGHVFSKTFTEATEESVTLALYCFAFNTFDLMQTNHSYEIIRLSSNSFRTKSEVIKSLASLFRFGYMGVPRPLTDNSLVPEEFNCIFDIATKLKKEQVDYEESSAVSTKMKMTGKSQVTFYLRLDEK